MPKIEKPSVTFGKPSKLSDNGVKHLVAWEGIARKGGTHTKAIPSPTPYTLKYEKTDRYYSYDDVSGYETIFCGHMLLESEKTTGIIILKRGTKEHQLFFRKDGITYDEGIELLHQDLAKFYKAVNDAVHVPLSQSQFDALVSLAFNIGSHAFTSSTLVRLLNDGDYDGAAKQFARWNKSNGKIVQGLVNRRAAEKALFLTI